MPSINGSFKNYLGQRFRNVCVFPFLDVFFAKTHFALHPICLCLDTLCLGIATVNVNLIFNITHSVLLTTTNCPHVLPDYVQKSPIWSSF